VITLRQTVAVIQNVIEATGAAIKQQGAAIGTLHLSSDRICADTIRNVLVGGKGGGGGGDLL